MRHIFRKATNLGTGLLIISSILGGCTGETPREDTTIALTSLTQDSKEMVAPAENITSTEMPNEVGYTRVVNTEFGYSFEYPEDWIYYGAKFLLLEDAKLNAEAVQKPGEGIVRFSVVINHTNLYGLAQSVYRQYLEYINPWRVELWKREVEVNGRQAEDILYEDPHERYQHLIFREVTFNIDQLDRAYVLQYWVSRDLYDTYVEEFNRFVLTFDYDD
jgi:hypothetical protein